MIISMYKSFRLDVTVKIKSVSALPHLLSLLFYACVFLLCWLSVHVWLVPGGTHYFPPLISRPKR